MGAIKDLQNLLLARISEHIEKYSFNKKPKGPCFYKKTSFGRLAFCLGFINHASRDFDVTGNVAIRFDALEELLNEGNTLLSSTMKKETFSLGAELGNISEGKQMRWTVVSVTDVEPVAVSIIDTFRKVGVPYLEKYSNLETALEALGGDDPSAWLHMPFHDLRAKRALGLAFLLGQKERLDSMALAKEAFLRAKNDPGLKSFLEFRDTLYARSTKMPNSKLST